MSDRDLFLKSFGWDDFFQASFEENENSGPAYGRIVGQGRGSYQIQFATNQVFDAVISSKLRRSSKADTNIEFPAVGDWVSFSFESDSPQAIIQNVLKRKSVIQRQKAGAQHGAQVIAANVDFMFVVSSLNEDFDLVQMGRYLALGRTSGATPIILLTKADLCANPDHFLKLCESEFKDVETILISNKDSYSLEALQKYFSNGTTSVLIGTSGVGKSTLTNFLLGIDSQKTQGLSTESRGKHTTTARYLLTTRWGGLVIDTPGMQDVATLESDNTEPKDFSDIEELMLQCKFTNCRHKNDPGCAITAGLQNGSLSQKRWDEYLEAVADAARSKKRR